MAHLSFHETKPAIYSPGMVIPIYGSSQAYQTLAADTNSAPAPQGQIARFTASENCLIRWSLDPTSGPQTFCASGENIDFYLEQGEIVRYTPA